MNWAEIIEKSSKMNEEQLRKLAKMNPNWSEEILALIDKKT